ncbi:metallophosphoesterase family protein [Nocardia aurantiaca]|uniref:Metallophosphoesterase n=1 Tax=Nocardia aurantiaca TaxID=2675850 RepID=A0A6I3L5B9_9NOCA|nr:metallophosphoesterase [Nocardia aurantiaca]MTE15725.1 metallophosphoesterase [Nocardia aurantiaca]
MRIAAVGDVHVGTDSQGLYRPALEDLHRLADVLLLAGDLTKCGTVAEARVTAREFSGLGIPVVAVLGNHDHHGDAADEIAAVLADAGIVVLEGSAVAFSIDGTVLGIAGTKGFGGGFAGRCASVFGEPLMREFASHTVDLADSLYAALSALDTDIRVALTHYSPIEGTLVGEPREIYPFLGSYLLGEAIDTAGADLALHGHAHAGTEHGETPGGIPVRNVAQPVLGAAYAVYELHPASPVPAARSHASS